MSQRNTLSLWQKLKRLLTDSAPTSVADGGDKPPQLSANDTDPTHSDTDSQKNSETGGDNKSTFDGDAGAGSAPDTKNNSQPSENDGSKRTEHRQHSDTPIVDILKQYFSSKQWHYTHYRPKTNDHQQSHHLSLRMRHKQLNCGYLFRVQEKNKLLAVYGILPFLIPESHQNAAMLLITQINYDMLIGSLEMDVNDGEIRYKNAIDVEVVGINDVTIEHLLQSVIAMTTVAHELFFNLVNHQDPAEDLQTLMLELRQQVDSRTFFLPTQFVQ